ncbi:DUF6897 domain-containing protein [Serpentinicella alkaliphila]|uniref:Uncharacterized protein n=1 Tax=Serpentinicella alkaliphila TaxID=1734049 RepID=A0A4R2SV95_9FIRM|nr:hypothetical protein [Serpentinicella alkaliphila]QUH27046.1 hypothetical protein HZR23_15845 [Serpentinicella alkaliphila]TCP93400.1 hypothetical protein EDD79_10785 [Serpentinicella alkaliphila]
MGRLGCTCNDLLLGIDLEAKVQINTVCQGMLTGTIENVTDAIIQLEQQPGRLTNICCDKICTIRNLTPTEVDFIGDTDLPPPHGV